MTTSNVNPKVSYIQTKIIPGETTLIGDEDRQYWSVTEHGVTLANDLNSTEPSKMIVLAEVLQRIDDPVQYLKDARAKAEGLVIVVPNEYAWLPQYQPMQNKKHKRFYDAELLAEDIDKAGMKYVMEQIDYSGWSFLGAIAQ